MMSAVVMIGACGHSITYKIACVPREEACTCAVWSVFIVHLKTL